ncbi:MAG: restriction system modified-DNA reader domain-containing protein [Bacteroidota bacterium]
MKSLITRHLEKISSKVFDEYYQEITKLVGKHHGVYALYKKNKLYYVGLAIDLHRRVKYHLIDNHSGKWDRFSLYLINDVEHLKELEALIIHIALPKGNKQLGRFSKSKSMQRELRQLVHTKNKEREASIFGVPKPDKKKEKLIVFAKYRSTPTKPGLKGLLPAGTELIAPYKGTNYTATVTDDGKILYDGKVFNSPSSAGEFIRGGKATNGWQFWRYRVNGKLKELRTLMR